MTDSTDRKTLVLKPGAREDSSTTPRRRSGARAWKVARHQADTRTDADAPAQDSRPTPTAPTGPDKRTPHSQEGQGRQDGGERRRTTDNDRAPRDRVSSDRAPRDCTPRPRSDTDFRGNRNDRARPDHKDRGRGQEGSAEHRSARNNKSRPGSEYRGRRNEESRATPPRGDRSERSRSEHARYETRALPGTERSGTARANTEHAGFARPAAPQREEPQRKPRGSRHLARDTRHYAAFASCPQGLEAALAQEFTQLGFEDVQAGRAGVHFRTDWIGMMRANLHSRLATRILLQVAQAPVSHEDDLLQLAHDTPWERWFGPEQTLRVDTSAIRSPMQSLQYCTLRTKDGICDRLRDREGARPSIDTVRPDARVHVFLNETTATLYLDTSGESLFKRGWRLDKGEAPLRENLAAGMLALSGWPGDVALLDPFCGSGTILIEAAYQALRVPPGISRPFAFERLRNHDAILWRKIKEEARSHILPQLTMPLIGSDLSPAAIAAAKANAARAGLTEDAITFEVRDAVDLRPPLGEPGWIVTNPPYGSRLAVQSHDRAESEQAPATAEADPSVALWQEFAKTLKGHFDGWQAHIITTDRDLPRHLRLSATRRTPLYNGALDCRLFSFSVVAGTYRQRL